MNENEMKREGTIREVSHGTETRPDRRSADATPRRGRAARIFGALALATLLAWAATALAGGRPGGRGGWFPAAGLFRAVGDLDLTEQQEIKAVKIRRQMRQSAGEIRRDLRGALPLVISELEKPAPDAARLHGTADEALKRFSKLLHSGIDQLLELHATFTPEQRAKLVEHARRAEERMREHEDAIMR